MSKPTTTGDFAADKAHNTTMALLNPKVHKAHRRLMSALKNGDMELARNAVDDLRALGCRY